MFYVYYDADTSLINCVSNAIDDANGTHYLNISQELFLKFNEGELNFNDFAIVDSKLIEKKEQPIESAAYKIKLSTISDNAIEVVQDCTNKKWIIKNKLDSETTATLKLMDNYKKHIFVVDSKNNNILHEILSIPVHDVLDHDLYIDMKTCVNEVDLVCRNSYETYIYIQEKF